MADKPIVMIPIPVELKTKIASPWFIWEILLSQNYISEKEFNNLQKIGGGLVGFIIAKWKNREPKYYLTQNMSWLSFTDETVAMYPKIYKTQKGILTGLEKQRNQGYKDIGIILWAHPDSNAEPLEKIVRMTEGRKFPGSPRQ